MKNPVIRSTPVAYGIVWALVIGHVAAMVCALLSELLLNRAYRVRVERERQDDEAVDGPPS